MGVQLRHSTLQGAETRRTRQPETSRRQKARARAVVARGPATAAGAAGTALQPDVNFDPLGLDPHRTDLEPAERKAPTESMRGAHRN